MKMLYRGSFFPGRLEAVLDRSWEVQPVTWGQLTWWDPIPCGHALFGQLHRHARRQQQPEPADPTCDSLSAYPFPSPALSMLTNPPTPHSKRRMPPTHLNFRSSSPSPIPARHASTSATYGHGSCSASSPLAWPLPPSPDSNGSVFLPCSPPSSNTDPQSVSQHPSHHRIHPFFFPSTTTNSYYPVATTSSTHLSNHSSSSTSSTNAAAAAVAAATAAAAAAAAAAVAQQQHFSTTPLSTGLTVTPSSSTTAVISGSGNMPSRSFTVSELMLRRASSLLPTPPDTEERKGKAREGREGMQRSHSFKVFNFAMPPPTLSPGLLPVPPPLLTRPPPLYR